MTEGDDIAALDKKLKKLRQTEKQGKSAQSGSSDEAQQAGWAGMQVGMEFVGAILGGAFIGYLLDNWLETKPIFFFLMFFLGVFTGFYNLYRLTNNKGTAVGLHPTAKTAKEDAESESGG